MAVNYYKMHSDKRGDVTICVPDYAGYKRGVNVWRADSKKYQNLGSFVVDSGDPDIISGHATVFFLDVNYKNNKGELYSVRDTLLQAGFSEDALYPLRYPYTGYDVVVETLSCGNMTWSFSTGDYYTDPVTGETIAANLRIKTLGGSTFSYISANSQGQSGSAIIRGGGVMTLPWIYADMQYSSSVYGALWGCANLNAGVMDEGEIIMPSTTVDRYLPAIASGTPKIADAMAIAALQPIPGPLDPDPLTPGGVTGEGGGDGTFDAESDPIIAPNIPQISASQSGFVTVYNPTISQVQQLANYMWSDTFSLDGFKRLFADPMDVIIALTMLPINVPSSGSREVMIGNWGTGVYMPVANVQYVSHDCGAVAVNKYAGNYLDYAPYTTVQLYLPYIGCHDLDTDEVMDHTIGVRYAIDIITGSCCAYVTVDGSVMYQYTGSMAAQIPVTGRDSSAQYKELASCLTGIASGTFKGGISGAIGGAIEKAPNAINAAKPVVERSGSLGGMSGFLGYQKPYIIIHRPRQALPEGQNNYTGYPGYMRESLGSLHGYTEIDRIFIQGITCTDAENTEISALLKEGVIF